MHIVVVGTDYHLAPVAVRERLAFRASMPSGLRAKISPASVLVPARGRADVALEVAAAGTRRPAGYEAGLVSATATDVRLSIPVGVALGAPPPARLGPLRLESEGGRPNGVRFTAGAVARPGDALAVEPIGRLTLQLVNAAGRPVRELTPPGGAPDLLPGEYAYTLTRATRDQLDPGRYRFVARARATAGGSEARVGSPSFTVR